MSNKYHDKKPELCHCIEQFLYADDLVTGANSVDDAFKLYKVAKTLMSNGGFNLYKWKSNSPSLLVMIKSDQNDQNAKSVVGGVNETKPEPDKLLGIQWFHEPDEFRFCFGELQAYAWSLPSSKRTVLCVTAAILDPMGFLSPFVVLLKWMFQLLCVQKSNWDDPLPSGLGQKWNQLLEGLNTLNKVIVPRCYFELRKHPERVELHGFSDASEHAYAAVLYIREIYSDGSVSMRLVAAKMKVTPLKKQSIPQLELLGAFILVRLTGVAKGLIPNLNCYFLWVNSKTVLCWIRNDKV